jgi:hypothetical protein
MMSFASARDAAYYKSLHLPRTFKYGSVNHGEPPRRFPHVPLGIQPVGGERQDTPCA